MIIIMILIVITSCITTENDELNSTEMQLSLGDKVIDSKDKIHEKETVEIKVENNINDNEETTNNPAENNNETVIYEIQIGDHLINLDETVNSQILYNMSIEEIGFLRNAMFAKYGYIFKTQKYSNYFSNYEWYVPKYEVVDEYISEKDMERINRYLEYEKKKDTYIIFEEQFESNNRLYKIILSLTNPYNNAIEYNNIIIYAMNSENEEIVFDLNKLNHRIDGISTDNGQFFDIYDGNNDGIDEIYFTEFGYASDIPRKLIISEIEGKYEILFFDSILSIEYIDIDKDGIKELYGSTVYGGQVSYNVGFKKAHRYIDNHYKPSYELTRDYEIRNVELYMEDLINNPSIENLDRLIYLYAYLGMVEKCNQIKVDYIELIDDVEKNEENYYKYYFFRAVEMSNYYKEIWKYFKSEEEAIETVEEYFDAQRTNDFDRFISVLTDDHGFTRENNSEFGVINLIIIDMLFESDSHFETRMLNSKKAEELGWNADNMSVVVVNFEAEYDNTKVPTQGGQKEYRFLLIRNDENSRWLIQDWGY